ncbi:MAG: enoyl-CoA hydratase/isomerase family protein [Deltaproteobacteria bacterium]|nr:enoyl-CoA hydratase/isomerase family protein [Deltaproteobacteria bacterium]
MSYQHMIFEVKDDIALVTFNRPETLNALNPELMQEFGDILDEIAAHESIAVVVLTGAGKAFVSGADIKAMSEFTPLQIRNYLARGHEILFKIESLLQPVIAAVNGFCLGGGNEIAMACDFVYASEKARFGQPEIKLGIIPGFGGTQRLPRLVGKGLAKELCLTGEFLRGQTALAVGLANKIFPPDKLMEETMKTARLIASHGRSSVRAVKQLVDRGTQIDLRAACALEVETFAAVFSSSDAKEGLTAFLEKRQPEFTGTYES